LEAKARPECDFRYRSNVIAFWRETKAMAVSMRYGMNLLV